MRNLTTCELFLKGTDAFNQEEFLLAEKYFLASLHEYSKKKDRYDCLLGSLDKLSLYLYPLGYYLDKERALDFYKKFNRVDANVSRGFTKAIINGVFDNPDSNEAISQIEQDIRDIDSMVVEFFKNLDNIPDLDTLTNAELPSNNQESDFNFQLMHLKRIFDDASMSPAFHSHPKYCIGKFMNMIPYISYNDIMNRKCIIRARPVYKYNSFDSEERDIIIQYESIEKLINDGWRLD